MEENGESKSDWSYCVGPGWRPIVDHAIETLTGHLGAEIIQVKEKFAGLRIYYSCPEEFREAAGSVVRAAEDICSKTCEICGAPGIRRIHRLWHKTLCDEHKDANVRDF